MTLNWNTRLCSAARRTGDRDKRKRPTRVTGERDLDGNLFMMCEQINVAAFSRLPTGYAIRNCRKDEIALWKSFPFDTAESAGQYERHMTAYFDKVYAPKGNLFFERCLFVVKRDADEPVATCFAWQAYGSITTIHWFKVLKPYEGNGIGRALLSAVMSNLDSSVYPVYLHTQPGGFRAIKLYSDFGFSLIDNPRVGNRINDLQKSLPYLKEVMPANVFGSLKFSAAPKDFVAAVEKSDTEEF
jgi:ribosomal protein S18 acetylase RimI-like enzyme